MPLTSDEKILALSNDLIHQFETLFGAHPGLRPVHAKGVLLSGTFTPSTEGASLTRAPHLSRASTPVTVRFSNSTGVPVIPDNDPNADPRGLAIRFHLAERVHTDIISHSADGFPVRTGQEFLELLRAIGATMDPSKPPTSPSPIEIFLGSHPSALAYVQMPKPAPASFAKANYFGVTAMRFINADGVARYGRFRIVPDAGAEFLDDATAKTKGPNYLFDELNERIAKGPIGFKVEVQVAEPSDVVDDATIHWPADRQVIPFGSISLTGKVPDDVEQQKHLIFDPIPRVDGIEPSDDPLLELRAATYLISGRRRRQS
jgi:catalase